MPEPTIGGAPPLLPYLTGGGVAPAMFNGLAISASGLAAQRARMEVASVNIANAETTRGPDGQPYRRKVVVLQQAGESPVRVSSPLPLPPGSGQDFADVARQALAAPPPDGLRDAGIVPPGGVAVEAIVEDPTPGALVYDPGHPDADAKGYVRYPNVQITTELLTLMQARRVYEANASAFQAGKAMLRRAIEI